MSHGLPPLIVTPALSLGEAAFYYPEGDRDGRAAAMVSHHSGLTPEEMRIPLIIA